MAVGAPKDQNPVRMAQRMALEHPGTDSGQQLHRHPGLQGAGCNLWSYSVVFVLASILDLGQADHRMNSQLCCCLTAGEKHRQPPAPHFSQLYIYIYIGCFF